MPEIGQIINRLRNGIFGNFFFKKKRIFFSEKWRSYQTRCILHEQFQRTCPRANSFQTLSPSEWHKNYFVLNNLAGKGQTERFKPPKWNVNLQQWNPICRRMGNLSASSQKSAATGPPPRPFPVEKRQTFHVCVRAQASLCPPRRNIIEWVSTLLGLPVRHVHRSALSDNRIRASRIKRGILLKRARQLLHFDPLFAGATDGRTRTRNSRRVNTRTTDATVEQKKKKRKIYIYIYIERERESERETRGELSFYNEIEVTVVASSPWPARLFFLRFPHFYAAPHSVKGVRASSRLNRPNEGPTALFRLDGGVAGSPTTKPFKPVSITRLWTFLAISFAILLGSNFYN